MKKILMVSLVMVFISLSHILFSQGISRDSLKLDGNLFLNQNRNALKFDASSFLNEVTSFTFEHCSEPGRSFEGTLGFIGAGIPIDYSEKPRGILFRGGYKMMLDIIPSEKIRNKHIMKGFYIKFEFDYANYSVYSSKEFIGDRERYRISKFALMGVFGYQHVFGDAFLINPYLAGGMGRNNLENFLDWSFPYGFTVLGVFASSVGIRAGILF